MVLVDPATQRTRTNGSCAKAIPRSPNRPDANHSTSPIAAHGTRTFARPISRQDTPRAQHQKGDGRRNADRKKHDRSSDSDWEQGWHAKERLPKLSVPAESSERLPRSRSEGRPNYGMP